MSFFSLALALAAYPTLLQDGDWPQFLGPKGTAVVEQEASQLSFDLERNKLWRVELPYGSSSPCIWGDRIFITGSQSENLVMMALDCKTGETLWTKTRKSPPMQGVAHKDAKAAAPTACTDGERVVFYFGQYGLVVLDMEGELLWEKPLPVPDAPFGVGTSPILLGDLLILSRDGCADSAIYAFDKHDGSERWRVPRVGYTFSFGTPFVWQNTERLELVVGGTQRLIGLDPSDGKKLWEVGGLTSLVCTTPTADEDTLYFAAWSTSDAGPDERHETNWGGVELSDEERASAEKLIAKFDQDGDGMLTYDEFPLSRARDAFSLIDRNQDGAASADELEFLIDTRKGQGKNLMIAIRAGGEGDVSASHVLWTHRRGLPYVSSPLLYRGRVYPARAGGLVTCLDAESGKPHFGPKRLEDHSESYASPVGIDGHVIL